MNNLSLSVFMPVIISFLISVVFCPILIPFLRKLKFGQTEREEGPQSHLKKNGTPTMGGLVILASILLTSLIYIGKFTEILPVLFMTLGFGLIGFLDDYIKVVKKRSLGLTPLQKMALQFIVTGVFIYYYFKIAGLDTSIKIPFVSGDGFVMPTWLFIIFVFIVVLGTVNGAKLYRWLRWSGIRCNRNCSNILYDCCTESESINDTDYRSRGRKSFGIFTV